MGVLGKEKYALIANFGAPVVTSFHFCLSVSLFWSLTPLVSLSLFLSHRVHLTPSIQVLALIQALMQAYTSSYNIQALPRLI